ncbi:Type I restriction enzyme (modification subunit), partial [gut metagenome]
MGLNIQSHLIPFDEMISFSSSVEAGTGMLEIFPFGSVGSSYCASQLENLLDNIPGPIAAILPPMMGFGSNLISSRRKLLESGRLHAIVSFPPGVFSGTSIPVDLYLISSKGMNPQEKVRMVSFFDDSFWESRPSRRGVRNFSANGIAQICNVLVSSPLDKHEALVSVEELLNSHDANLSVDHYVVDQTVVATKKLLDKFPRKLKDVADIVRPVPVRHTANATDKHGDEYREVGIQDINGIGVVETVSKSVFVEREKISKGFENMVLRDGDIVLFIKGNVGTCGLVNSGASNRICSQSAVIIRLRNDVKGISHVTMLRYLSSKLVLNYLATLTSGTSVRFLSVKMLENLPIPVFTEEAIQIHEQRF